MSRINFSLETIRIGTPNEKEDLNDLYDRLISNPAAKGVNDFWAGAGKTIFVGLLADLLYRRLMFRMDRAINSHLIYAYPTLKDLPKNFDRFRKENIEEETKIRYAYFPHIWPDEFMSDENRLLKAYGNYIADHPHLQDLLDRLDLISAHKHIKLSLPSKDVITVDMVRDYVRTLGIEDFGHKYFLDLTASSLPHSRVVKPVWRFNPLIILLTHPLMYKAMGHLMASSPETRENILNSIEEYIRHAK